MRHPRNYRLLIAIAFLQGFVFYGPVATIYRRAFGLDIQGLFLIESISWVLTLLLEAPWGRFADRYGFKKTLLLGNLAFLASKAMFSIAAGFWGFLAERILLSVALSALSGCTEALVYRSAGGLDAERAFGRWHAASAAGILFASIASPLVYAVSLRAAAYATIAPYAVAFALSLSLTDLGEEAVGAAARRTRPRGLLVAFRTLGSDVRLLAFLVIGALVGEASQAATVFLAPLQYERVGIPLPAFGLLFAALQGAGLTSAGAGRLSAALGRARTFRALVIAAAASLAALVLTGSAVVSVAALLALAAAAALFRPLSASHQNERVAGPDRATALSVNAMVMELVAAGVNVGVGKAARIGPEAAFGLMALALAAAALAPASIFAPAANGRLE